MLDTETSRSHHHWRSVCCAGDENKHRLYFALRDHDRNKYPCWAFKEIHVTWGCAQSSCTCWLAGISLADIWKPHSGEMRFFPSPLPFFTRQSSKSPLLGEAFLDAAFLTISRLLQGAWLQVNATCQLSLFSNTKDIHSDLGLMSHFSIPTEIISSRPVASSNFLKSKK